MVDHFCKDAIYENTDAFSREEKLLLLLQMFIERLKNQVLLRTR